MPEHIDPRGQDNPSTYFVQDRSNEAEMIRLLIQDQLVTAGMGGPLTEQPDPDSLRHILDIGCGPGGWVLETAARYPHIALVGIDISWRMIEYANAQAHAQKLTDGVSFRVMDATKPLDFSDASFDLVNIRWGSSFMFAKEWPALLREVYRVLRPGGRIRITETGEAIKSTSPSYVRLNMLLAEAMYRSGRHFTSVNIGIAAFIPDLLVQSGYQDVQIKAYALEFVAGKAGGQQLYQDAMYAFQTLRPFLQKWGCAPDDYDAIYQQAMREMQQKEFQAVWELVTTWATRPASPLVSER